MKLGILGTGKVALLLSGAWRNAGHEITLGSRDPSSKNLGFEVTSLADCVSGADVVVNAILGRRRSKRSPRWTRTCSPVRR